MFQFLQGLDSFPKARDDCRVKTSMGAVVSIVSIVIMVLLFVSEWRYHSQTETVDYLYVNTTRSNAVTIDFDLSFPSLSCNLLSVSALDDAGNLQTDAIHDVFKHRLGAQGERIGQQEKITLGETLRNEADLETAARAKIAQEQEFIKQKIGSCGNCYGAGRPGQCCQTCQDVKDSYARMGWRFKPQGILQCNSEAMMTHLHDQFAEDGGCQLYGRMHLNKASGHFHIAPHRKLHSPLGEGQDGKGPVIFNLMDLISFTFDQFNVSHTINSLSFGEQFPGVQSPLDGQSRVVEDTHGMYQYYLKVVPTRYRALGSEELVESNQYAVTELVSHLAPGSGRGLPGIYFYYEVSPIHARIEERKTSTWLRFLSSVCALVGGAYTVMGLIDLLLTPFLSGKDML